MDRKEIIYYSSCCKSSYIWTHEIYGICDKCKKECEILGEQPNGEVFLP